LLSNDINFSLEHPVSSCFYFPIGVNLFQDDTDETLVLGLYLLIPALYQLPYIMKMIFKNKEDR